PVLRNPLARTHLLYPLALQLIRPEVKQRQYADRRLGTKGRSKSPGPPHHFRDDGSRRLIQPQPAVFLRDGRAQQSQFASLGHKLTGHIPVVFLHRLKTGGNLAVDEFASRLADHLLLFGKILRRKGLFGRLLRDQKFTAFHIFFFHLCFHYRAPPLLILLYSKTPSLTEPFFCSIAR